MTRDFLGLPPINAVGPEISQNEDKPNIVLNSKLGKNILERKYGNGHKASINLETDVDIKHG